LLVWELLVIGLILHLLEWCWNYSLLKYSLFNMLKTTNLDIHLNSYYSTNWC
jgi:hypothetical protein